METSKYSLLFKHNFSFFQAVTNRKHKMQRSVAHYSKYASPCLSKACHAKGRNSFKHTQILRKSVNRDLHIHDGPLTGTMESLMEVFGDKKTEEYLKP